MRFAIFCIKTLAFFAEIVEVHNFLRILCGISVNFTFSLLLCRFLLLNLLVEISNHYFKY